MFQEVFSLSQDQEEALKDIYNRFDRDGDGEITQDEIRAVFKELGLSFDDDQLANVMGKFEVTEKGGITWESWIPVMAWHLTKDLDEIFRTFDKNR